MLTVDLAFIARVQKQPLTPDEVDAIVAASAPAREWHSAKINAFLTALKTQTAPS